LKERLGEARTPSRQADWGERSLMHLKLHANATTTPRTRAYIQQSHASNTALARQLGIHSRTVARWKSRQDVADRSTRPQRLATTMTAWEEGLIVELRRSLALPLDDILEAMRRCLNPKLSRSGIHRCLQRHRLSARLTPPQTPAIAFQTDAPAGFIHIDVKYLPPLNRRRSYAYVAIDRATRFVYLEILPDRRATTAAGFLARFLDNFPLEVHTILTDNGSEFTDRFAVDKKAKPQDRPSGHHPFDRICTERAITHRLTQPFRPQTNGMVERFNRRLGEHLGRMPQNRAAHHRRFLDHAERDAYLHTFVADYNRTRLRCLDYQAPAELLANLTRPGQALLAFDYHGFDRIVIYGYLSGLSRPEQIVHFFPPDRGNAHVRGKRGQGTGCVVKTAQRERDEL
jgi:transposase InsO family protein